MSQQEIDRRHAIAERYYKALREWKQVTLFLARDASRKAGLFNRYEETSELSKVEVVK